jgi:putative ABC transport system permease protein
MLQDVRFALRGLRRAPGFTAVAAITLALGIGATATIFTVVNGVLLKPLPYAAADRLANIWVDLGEGAQSLPAVSAGDFRDYQRRSRAFEEFAAASGPLGSAGNLTGPGAEPEPAIVTTVTHNFFSLLGVRPQLGRTFTAAEEAFQGPRVMMLSDALWRRRFGGDPGIVGRAVELDGLTRTVVGVLPAGFRLLLPAEAFMVRDAEVWLPLQWNYANLPPRNFTTFTVFGRLKPGVSWEQARADMSRIAGELRAEFPEHAAANTRIRPIPLQHDVVKGARPALVVLLAATGLVLLIACANVAHLLLARGTVRAQEFAVRAALGAGRGAMVRQLLTESAVLAMLGGALGLAVASAGIWLLNVLRPANLPRLAEVQVDGTVLGFTLAICAATTLLFGLAPALQGSKADMHSVMRAGGGARGGTGGGRQRLLRDVLIVGEVALSMLLLVGAGLLARSFARLQDVRPGFEASNALTFQVAVPFARYGTPRLRTQFRQQLEERLAAIPGVERVGAVSKLPLTGSGPLQPYAYDEETARNWESVTADVMAVSPGYFPAVGARLLAGRLHTEQDVFGAPRVIVIDRTLAERAWPGENAVGKRLRLEPLGTPDSIAFAEVVGVVEHLRIHDLMRDGLAQIYWSYGQRPFGQFGFVLRTTVHPASLTSAVRREVRAMDRDIAVSRLMPMDAYVSDARAQSRFSLILMAALGSLALVLAAVGIFGVVSYSVSRRTREIGIRMALGEEPAQVRRSVVAQGMRLILASIAVGLAITLAAAPQLSGLLFDVSPRDPATLLAVSAFLALVALLACYLPARRATRIDPLAALRAE